MSKIANKQQLTSALQLFKMLSEYQLCWMLTAVKVSSLRSLTKRKSKQSQSAASSNSFDVLVTAFLLRLFFLSDRGTESFVHKPDFVHGCKQDMLLCRRKTQPPTEWTRVRPIPKWMGFSGPYKLCKGTNLPAAWLISIACCASSALIVASIVMVVATRFPSIPI